jgi:hypothetical protein
MNERPILFSAPMVRAILEGRKTQTRRLATNALNGWGRCAPGDRLWVREACAPGPDPAGGYIYRADSRDEDEPDPGRWTPSIFMPRSASRITLRVVSVHSENLQDISDADILAEGFTGTREAFATGWDEINGDRGPWASNPLVWVIRFEREVTP